MKVEGGVRSSMSKWLWLSHRTFRKALELKGEFGG